MTSSQASSIFCSHCGTRNKPDAYICDRCGERVYRPNADHPPPLGLAACGRCNAPNEAHAFYCANCGHSMESAVRISPEGAVSSSRVAEKPQRTRVKNPPPPPRRTPEPRAGTGDRESVQPTQGLPNSTGSAAENGSGVRDAELPKSLRGFNWGAFLMGPIWSLFNQVWIGLIGFISVIPQIPIGIKILIVLALALYLGFKGNELAWRSKKWSSTAHFASTQRTWLIVGLAATAMWAILSIIVIQGGSAPGETVPIP